MTEKQNYMLLLSGQQPEWVPHYSFGVSVLGGAPPVKSTGPSILHEFLRTPGVKSDIWGVPHIPVPEAGNAKIPEPNFFILKDITKWRDVIKAPDYSHIDWEAMAKKDLEDANREETALSYGLFVGFFQTLAEFMGFSEALCAMYEEPEEVKALMEYLCDFYCDIAEKTIDLYKPDIFNITDDTATWQNPFFSNEMYRELIKPYAMRLAKYGTDRGLPVEMHNCGRCEDSIDDWRDFGVVSWNPAQISNDLLGIKKKYGNSLVINGAWSPYGDLLKDDVTEEQVKESVYESIRTFAPGGGYAFCGSFLGPIDDEKTIRKNRWLAEAAYSFGRSFYK